MRQFVCGFVLLWTLTFISMDRHKCLAVAPYRSTLTVAIKVVATSLLTWLIAALVFLPAAFWFQTRVCVILFIHSFIHIIQPAVADMLMYDDDDCFSSFFLFLFIVSR